MSLFERVVAITPMEMLANCATLALAFVLALPVGWERERAGRAAGIRTFALVSVASCAYMLIGRALGEAANMHYVLQGLMTGLGFLGAGVIIRGERGRRIRGTATAVALWSTAAIGAAVAYGRLEIALVLAALDVVGLHTMRRVEKRFRIDEEDAARPERPAPNR
jgi:putative Mg2+ transporter-C (MgtC) family protein